MATTVDTTPIESALIPEQTITGLTSYTVPAGKFGIVKAITSVAFGGTAVKTGVYNGVLGAKSPGVAASISSGVDSHSVTSHVVEGDTLSIISTSYDSSTSIILYQFVYPNSRNYTHNSGSIVNNVPQASVLLNGNILSKSIGIIAVSATITRTVDNDTTPGTIRGYAQSSANFSLTLFNKE